VPLRRLNLDIICKRYLLSVVTFKYFRLVYCKRLLKNEGHPYRKNGGARRTTDYLVAVISDLRGWRENFTWLVRQSGGSSNQLTQVLLKKKKEMSVKSVCVHRPS